MAYGPRAFLDYRVQSLGLHFGAFVDILPETLGGSLRAEGEYISLFLSDDLHNSDMMEVENFDVIVVGAGKLAFLLSTWLFFVLSNLFKAGMD